MGLESYGFKKNLQIALKDDKWNTKLEEAMIIFVSITCLMEKYTLQLSEV